MLRGDAGEGLRPSPRAAARAQTQLQVLAARVPARLGVPAPAGLERRFLPRLDGPGAATSSGGAASWNDGSFHAWTGPERVPPPVALAAGRSVPPALARARRRGRPSALRAGRSVPSIRARAPERVLPRRRFGLEGAFLPPARRCGKGPCRSEASAPRTAVLLARKSLRRALRETGGFRPCHPGARRAGSAPSRLGASDRGPSRPDFPSEPRWRSGRGPTPGS
jgi:hypothetical protein